MMEILLKTLLDELDSIAEEYEEIGDTDVRECMSDVIVKGFIQPEDGYVVPDDFQLFNPAGHPRIENSRKPFSENVLIAGNYVSGSPNWD